MIPTTDELKKYFATNDDASVQIWRHYNHLTVQLAELVNFRGNDPEREEATQTIFEQTMLKQAHCIIAAFSLNVDRCREELTAQLDVDLLNSLVALSNEDATPKDNA